MSSVQATTTSAWQFIPVLDSVWEEWQLMIHGLALNKGKWGGCEFGAIDMRLFMQEIVWLRDFPAVLEGGPFSACWSYLVHWRCCGTDLPQSKRLVSGRLQSCPCSGWSADPIQCRRTQLSHTKTCMQSPWAGLRRSYGCDVRAEGLIGLGVDFLTVFIPAQVLLHGDA